MWRVVEVELTDIFILVVVMLFLQVTTTLSGFGAICGCIVES